MNLRFELKDQAVEESTKNLKYSDHKTYNTIVHDLTKTGDDIIYEGGVSYNRIKNSKIDEIPAIYAEFFKIEAINYITDHNSSMASGTTKSEIRYEISALNDDASFEYVKYVNDKEVERGATWYHRLESKTDKKAFVKAIKKFRSENGVRGPLWKIKKTQKDVDDAINSLDDWVPDVELPDPPLVESAATETVTDPCKFLKDLKHASNIAITKMHGVVPNPQEVLTYAIKCGTSATCQIARKLVSSISPIIKGVASPITNQLPSFDDPDNLDNGDNNDYYNSFSGYFDELDAINEEQRKKDSELYATYETVSVEFKKYISSVGTSIISEGNTSSWLDCIERMGEWYRQNVHFYQGAKYDEYGHIRPGYDASTMYPRLSYKCELLSGPETGVADDCAGFVLACLVLFGIPAGLHNACQQMAPGHQMKKSYVKKGYRKFEDYMKDAGFECIEYNKNDLKKGDIVLNPTQHVQIYWGLDTKGKRMQMGWGSCHDGLKGHPGMPCGYGGDRYTYIWRYKG